jgi:hypothetical protein
MGAQNISVLDTPSAQCPSNLLKPVAAREQFIFNSYRVSDRYFFYNEWTALGTARR